MNNTNPNPEYRSPKHLFHSLIRDGRVLMYLSILRKYMADDERLALSPTINVDNTRFASRPNDAPYDIFIRLIDLLMLGECSA
jgi:hypothetical protein